MGLIYSMVSLSINKAAKTLPSLSASNLADFLRSQTDVAQRTFYLYGNHCNKILFDPNLSDDVLIDKSTFSKNSAAFWFDNYGNIQELEFAPLKLDHFNSPVCLQVERFANGSTSALLIRSGKHFIFHSYFDGTQTFTSLEEASQWLKHKDFNPENLGLIFWNLLLHF